MPDADMKDCEVAIDADAEMQWRQVHPRFVESGVVSFEAFVGVDGFRREVSTSRSSAVSAGDAFVHHTESLELASAGTWATTVEEIMSASCSAIDDSACEDVGTPGHSYIDMRALPKPQVKAARVELAAAATTRGRQHPAL